MLNSMPRRDFFHDDVRAALIKDGWIITDDPYILPFGTTSVYIDLGAEHAPLGAERDGRKIAVEVKSFRSPSVVADLESALGQFVLYRTLIARDEPERVLYVALPSASYTPLFDHADARLLVPALGLRILVVNAGQEIEQWVEP